jgi:hypothetical protein
MLIQLDLGVKIRRRPKGDSFAFVELFQGFENVDCVRRIFGSRTPQVLERVRVLLKSCQGYLRVDNDTGDIIICSPYLKAADERYLYLDLVHELVHVRQFKEGKNLFDKRYSYVDRPTEMEAYSVAVEEAKRIGMKHAELVDYLKVEWVNDHDFKRMLTTLKVTPGSRPKRAARKP